MWRLCEGGEPNSTIEPDEPKINMIRRTVITVSVWNKMLHHRTDRYLDPFWKHFSVAARPVAFPKFLGSETNPQRYFRWRHKQGARETNERSNSLELRLDLGIWEGAGSVRTL